MPSGSRCLVYSVSLMHSTPLLLLQILGFDILLTDSCVPMLLEVNANPSLRIDFEQEIAPGIYEYVHSPVDEEIKRPLVMDTLILAAPRHKPLLHRYGAYL